MGGIHRIERVAYTSGRVERVTNYTVEERVAKLKEIEQAAADRAEIRDYLAKFPNPNNLSFAELLEQALKNQETDDEEIAYILDIGNEH